MATERILDLTGEYTWNEYREIMRSGLDIYDSNVTIEGSKKTLFEVTQDKKYDKQREFKKDEENFIKRFVKDGIRDNLEAWFLQFKGEKVNIKIDQWIYRSIENPFMICKPMHDIVYQGDICGLLIGIQDFMPYEWNNEENEKVPDKNKCWAYHMMAVMGYERVVIIILNNWQFELRIVENNQLEINDLIQAEKQIWQKYIQGEEIPPVMGMDVDLIDEIYKEKKPERKDCNQINGVIFRYWEIVKEEGKVRILDKEKQQCKAQIKKYLENAIEGYTSDFIIKNKKPFSIKPKPGSVLCLK